jgi:alanine racemase
MTAMASRPTIAEIDLNKLRRNFRSCREFIDVGAKIMAVVKAGAYGHGAVQCSRVLEFEGVDWLGVATPEEALELRSARIETPILCLGGFWPGQANELIENRITPVIFELSSAIAIDSVSKAAGIVSPVHLKVDTGMGRLGVRWNNISELLEAFRSLNCLRIEGVMTHFASADDPTESDFTNLQVTRFHAVVDEIRAGGHSPEIIDLSNSPGAVTNGSNGGNLVRLGGVLYGLADDILPRGIRRPALEPVMWVRSQISHLKIVPAGESIGYGRTFFTQKESRIAAVPIGYYDGYRRSFSNRAKMIVRGHLVPVVGRVSMDWTMVDVTHIPDVRLGDNVTIIGTEGDVTCTAADLAGLMDTISYEVTCGMSSRVTRAYVGERTT